MDHVAIMKKQLGFIDKILNGEKTIESRWYKTKHKPWDMIKRGDIIYFKNSGEPVSLKSEVKRVLQYSNVNDEKLRNILLKHGKNIGIGTLVNDFNAEFIRGKKYCILIFLKNPKAIKPFAINKQGFGAMASWISIEDINEIKL